MGCDLQVYIGAYIKCIPNTLWVNERKKVCPNKHSITDDAVFCSKCGSEIVEVSHKVKCENSSYTMTEKINEEFYCPEIDGVKWHCFIPNRDKYDYVHLSSDSQGGVSRIDPSFVDKTINLITKNSKLLQAFYDEYGQDHVTVEFGVIHYWS